MTMWHLIQLFLRWDLKAGKVMEDVVPSGKEFAGDYLWRWRYKNSINKCTGINRNTVGPDTTWVKSKEEDMNDNLEKSKLWVATNSLPNKIRKEGDV